MKLAKLKIKNFRSYKNEVCIEFNNLTAFVGKNDIGKSTILEAMDLFFNDGKEICQIEKDDINKDCLAAGDFDTEITAVFSDFPNSIVLDATVSTDFSSEFLLNNQNMLEIKKVWNNAGKPKVYIRANAPLNPPDCIDLWNRQKELAKIIRDNNIECADNRINSYMRKAIWNHFANDITCNECDIDVSKGETKTIWEKIQGCLPRFSLFQSDRKNSDGDSEIQDPLQEAVRLILNENQIKQKLSAIAEEVSEKLKDVSERTLEKLREMNPDIASTLTPVIPPSESLKWKDIFKGVSIQSDRGVSINKRGSGVKRLILLNFFRAEAERRRDEIEGERKHIIYAIEEPETSQHFEHQRILINALNDLAATEDTQVVLTTHSSLIVKNIEKTNIRIIEDNGSTKLIKNVGPNLLPYVSINEINFLNFGEYTEEYHNELYGFIQKKAINENADNFKEKNFEEWLISKGCTQTKQWKRESSSSVMSLNSTLYTYIRNFIHHPENQLNTPYTFDEIKQSINEMRHLIASL